MRFLRCSISKIPEKNNKKISIIGAGPAGLGAAGYLACLGYELNIYDAHPEPGGLLMFGIPEYRVAKEGIRQGIKELTSTGRIAFKTGFYAESDAEIEKAMDGADALLIATGTLRTRKLGIPCEESPQVFPAVEWLIDYHRAKLGYKPMFGYSSFKLKDPVAVIGGGLTAADAAQISLVELGLKTIIIYRRTKSVAPMGAAEATRLEKEGAKFLENLQPKEFLCDREKNLLGGIFYKTMLSGNSREAPLIYVGEVKVDFYTAMNAAGAKPTPPPGIEKLGVKMKEDGTIIINNSWMTDAKGIFAAGDVTIGPSKIGLALKSGIDAAVSIDKFLTH